MICRHEARGARELARRVRRGHLEHNAEVTRTRIASGAPSVRGGRIICAMFGCPRVRAGRACDKVRRAATCLNGRLLASQLLTDALARRTRRHQAITGQLFTFGARS